MKIADAPDTRALVARHYGAVWSLARKLTHDDATASDIAQETFARALAHIGDDVHSVASWLLKIATNLVRANPRGGLRTVQLALRHSSLAMTEIYMHPSTDDLIAGVQGLPC